MIVTWTVGPPGGEARYASAAVPATNTPTARTAKSARLRSIPRCILGRPPLQIGPRPRVRLPEGLAPGVPGVQECHRDARGAVPHQEDAHLRRGAPLSGAYRAPPPPRATPHPRPGLLLPGVEPEPQGVVPPPRTTPGKSNPARKIRVFLV